MSNIKENHGKKYIPVDLNEKINEFLCWYQDIIKCRYSDSSYQHYYVSKKCEEVRNLIDTIAVWYKLRYPDSTISRIRKWGNRVKSENIMFEDNSYIDALFDKKDDVRLLDWCDFYNPQVFIKSLPSEERKMLIDTEYYITHFDIDDYTVILTPNKDGRVKKVEIKTQDIFEYFKAHDDFIIKGDLKAKELIGLSFKEVHELLKKRGIKLQKNNQLARDIRDYDNSALLREGILDCAMYRIITMGGKYFGPYRAFLFAKEFGRNINIPMFFAVDRTDCNLREFIIEYLKAGGQKDLECYDGYFNRKSDIEPLSMVSIQELLLTQAYSSDSFYTPEETELHQRLVDAVSRKKLNL